jgi:hypothetical protein
MGSNYDALRYNILIILKSLYAFQKQIRFSGQYLHMHP